MPYSSIIPSARAFWSLEDCCLSLKLLTLLCCFLNVEAIIGILRHGVNLPVEVLRYTEPEALLSSSSFNFGISYSISSLEVFRSKILIVNSFTSDSSLKWTFSISINFSFLSISSILLSLEVRQLSSSLNNNWTLLQVYFSL